MQVRGSKCTTCSSATTTRGDLYYGMCRYFSLCNIMTSLKYGNARMRLILRCFYKAVQHRVTTCDLARDNGTPWHMCCSLSTQSKITSEIMNSRRISREINRSCACVAIRSDPRNQKLNLLKLLLKSLMKTAYAFEARVRPLGCDLHSGVTLYSTRAA